MSKLNPNSLKPKSKNKKEVDAFIQGANSHSTTLNPDEKPSQSFTTPVNAYELDLLRRVSEKNDRSMRKESRRLLVKMLLEEIDK